MTAYRQRQSPPIPINSSDGKIRDISEVPNFTNTSPAVGPVAPYHTGSICTEHLSPDWAEHHKQINNANPAAASPTTADMQGFVPIAFAEAQAFDQQGIRLVDQAGRRAMGYFDESDMPYYYFMAANFAMSDMLFSPMPSSTTPNRMYLHAATSQGFVHIPSKLLTAKTIWQALDEANISWKIYVTDFDLAPKVNGFKTYLQFFTYYTQPGVQAKVVPISEYFTDLQNNTLPSVALIEAGYFSGRDEHTSNVNPALGGPSPQSVQAGAAHVANVVNALMRSTSWKDSIFLFAFDEGGGVFDHVPPTAVPNPDGITPLDLLAKDVPGDFTMTGVRIPNFIVSPFAKKNFVSHTAMDYTAFLRLIETRFGLAPLTRRDAAMPDMTEFFDFANGGPWATPPAESAVPVQPTNGNCDFARQFPG